MRLDHIEVMQATKRSVHAERFASLLFLLSLLVVPFIWHGCQSVRADADDPGLVLARTCVSERGWELETDDCSAIYAVALRRIEIRGGTLFQALRQLSPRLHGRTAIRRAWLRGLNRDGDRPSSWPSHVSWEHHRPLWLATLEEADALVAGERTHVCSELPSAWGSHEDVSHVLAGHENMLRWVDVDCGNTRNRVGRWERRR